MNGIKVGAMVTILRPSQYPIDDSHYSATDERPSYFNDEGLMDDLIGRTVPVMAVNPENKTIRVKILRESDRSSCDYWTIKHNHYVLANNRFY